MRNINKYEVFKRSHKLTLEIYKITKKFPEEELYGLTSQMRRATYSIPMNLKEGSCEELDYQLLLSKDLNYITEDKYKNLHVEIVEIRKMLYSLLNKKENKDLADS